MIAVEANPHLLDYMTRLHALNKVRKVRRVNAVLTNGPETSATFYLRRDFWMGSLAPAPNPYIGTVEVPTMNLDALLRDEAIDLVVCDVEGAETVLFQGADLSGVDRIFLETARPRHRPLRRPRPLRHHGRARLRLRPAPLARQRGALPEARTPTTSSGPTRGSFTQHRATHFLYEPDGPNLHPGGAMIEGSCLCGAVRWEFDGVPEGATACNCTACRRYGTLWAYDYEGERIRVSGPTRRFARGTRPRVPLLPDLRLRGLLAREGARRSGAPADRREPAAGRAGGGRPPSPSTISTGSSSFDDLPRDGSCVADMWF